MKSTSYPVKICEVGERLADGLLFDREGGEHHFVGLSGKIYFIGFLEPGMWSLFDGITRIGRVGGKIPG